MRATGIVGQARCDSCARMAGLGGCVEWCKLANEEKKVG